MVVGFRIRATMRVSDGVLDVVGNWDRSVL